MLYDGQYHILSNNHVLGRSGTAVAGEDTLQPALIDTGCRATNSNVVGDYAGNLVPLGSANVDAAISTARAGMVDTSGAIIDIGVPRSAIQAPTIGLNVMKSGRTTGFTTGTITSLNTTVSIRYQAKCNSGKKFVVTAINQIVTGDMSDGGDSGSLLLSDDGSPNPVGLLYAGSSATTIFNPIQDVIDAFSAGGHSFSFVGSSSAVRDPAPTQVTPTESDMLAVLAAKVQNEDSLMKVRGVMGVGIGQAEDNPLEPVIVVYFNRKHLLELPPVLDGFRLRVVISDEIVAQ